MEALLAQIEWGTVGVSFFVAFFLGFLWYSPLLFAKKWQEGIGVAPDDNSPMMNAMIAQAAGTFFLALVVNLTTVSVAALVAVTFATLIKANGFFSQKSLSAIAIEAGYILVMVASMVAVNHWM